LGQDAEALRHYAEVLALQEETGARMEAASTRTSMALLHLDRGEAAEALALLDAVLDRRGDSENRLDLPRALVQRGRAFLMLKRPREAVRDLERAADIGRRENSPYVLNWALVFLSDAWAAMGRTEKAREIAQEALRLVEQSASPAPDGLRRAHMAMAGTERRARRFGEASRHYEAAVGVIEDVRSGLGQSEQRMSFLEKQLNLYEDYSSLLLAMSLDRRGEDAAGAPFRAFHLGERMKARAFLEELGRSRFLREGVAPEMMERRERLEEEVQRLRFLVAKSGETK
jgi:tetratricopeptide (TPR) repeat protein